MTDDRPDEKSVASPLASPLASPGGQPRDEPRAGDVIRGKVPQEELDPATVAQLAAWFGAPAAALDETAEAQEDDGEYARWLRRKKERLAVVEEATDPVLLDKLESWATAGDAFIKLPEPWQLPIERGIAVSDGDDWSMLVVETREWERPDEIVDGVKEAVPQAVLRDLYRPVLEWPKLFLPNDIGMDVAGLAAMTSIRETMATRQQVNMSELAIASVAGRREMAELQGSLDEPWDEIEIPEERKSGRGTSARTPEDFMWFGSVGYDPTV